jgi:hypothetical protein
VTSLGEGSNRRVDDGLNRLLMAFGLPPIEVNGFVAAVALGQPGRGFLADLYRR